ncbi:heme-binding protein [Nocardioides sp. cx-173]|uniref:GlcG/HbpS family heme-binding protein n=1 Tax=Nocardioides sp. cx-173 TaxID=2898796 RepID=UPI001E337417|nr:heme-binding protein [Nocardioides sp. cx-173]MCD4526588.1 heme-binding protein [Nocardioides sp. cx-173]UGB40683.1 heme-binding protein [Nocardioides sp. cx-173]
MRLETAQRLLTQVQEAAAASSLRLSMVVVDAGGIEVASARMDEAGWFTLGIARSKARTAVAFGRPSAELAAMRDAHPDVWRLADDQLPFAATTLPGGILIREEGAVVGAIGVSGAAPEVDVAVAEHAVATLAQAPSGVVPAGGTGR